MHRDALGKQRRVVWDVILVAEKQLKRMVAGLERDGGFGLSSAEMQVIEIARDRLIKRRQIGIDEKVMMTRIWALGARRRHAHVFEPKMNREF
jgi:hypothetical protein